jgi:polysaccharide biosynthesis transport protein
MAADVERTNVSRSDGSFEQALTILRRRKLVVLVALIFVPLAAYLVSSSKEKQYTATATLLFESGEEGAGVEATRIAATNEILAGLPVIAVKTAKALNGEVSAGEILASIKAGSANEMANVTDISATTSDPQLSAVIANAYSQAYIEFRGEATQKGLSKEIEKAEAEIESLAPDEASGIRSEKLRERLDALELEKALRTEKTSIVQPAGVPGSPSSPKVKRDVIVGLLIGLILGLGLAALLERIDRRVRSIEELEQVFGLPALAKIPKASAFEDADLSELLLAPEAEAFRTLRTNLRYFNVDATSRVILIASPEPADGKSTVARGLAGAMAQLGDNVVLVEADLRKESSLGSRGVGPREGLSTVLSGGSLDGALIEIPISDGISGGHPLWALPSGPVPPSPPQLLESEGMRALVEELTQRFDIVIFDSPALGYVSDALALVPLSTEIIAVGGLGRTRRDDVEQFRRHLSLTGNEPIGLVVTMTAFDRSQYSYYMRARRPVR